MAYIPDVTFKIQVQPYKVEVCVGVLSVDLQVTRHRYIKSVDLVLRLNRTSRAPV
jgi:hypothetical protein